MAHKKGTTPIAAHLPPPVARPAPPLGVTARDRGMAPPPGSTASQRGGSAGPGRGTPSRSAILAKTFGHQAPARPGPVGPPPGPRREIPAMPGGRSGPGRGTQVLRRPTELYLPHGPYGGPIHQVPQPKFVPTVKLDASQIQDRRKTLLPSFRGAGWSPKPAPKPAPMNARKLR